MSASPRPLPGEQAHAKLQATARQSSHSRERQRQSSQSSSDSSSSSQVTTLSSTKPTPFSHRNDNGTTSAMALTSAVRTVPFKSAHDLPLRQQSPTVMGAPEYNRHRHIQHSQGFFEPSLPTASLNNSPATTGYTASQIAAQAAMHIRNPLHARIRSQTIPDPMATSKTAGKRKPSYPPPIQSSQSASSANVQGRNGSLGGNQTAATTAALVAFPPVFSPGLPRSDHFAPPSLGKEPKPHKEKSMMKLFSKPKHITISKDKDMDRRPAIPSPKRPGIYSSASSTLFASRSTTSLADSTIFGASAMYSSANGSTSTLVPIERSTTGGTMPGEKDKHRHHFLSRQKNKLRDNNDHHNLALSSASSNSRPADPNAPQSLYSFAPSSPGPSSTFNKSISGLDLRHGGRALREKKREEKAAAASGPTLPFPNTSSVMESGRDHNLSGTSDWPVRSTLGVAGAFGPPSAASAYSHGSEVHLNPQGLVGLGLPGMTPDDAWPLLKARLLNIFEGEDIRTPIEDFNRLVSVHLQRCIQRRAPNLLIEELRELFQTGFTSLDLTLRHIPHDRLVPHLVDMWSFVFGTILPFMQAVFLPLDLELKGRGPILSPREAAIFWSSKPFFSKATAPTNTARSPSFSNTVDVRTLVLLTFRDTIILPRNDTLLGIFSHLSLDSIHGPAFSAFSPQYQRPGTATSSTSVVMDPAPTSFNSQGSTLLDSSTAGSLGARSRATSNTSAGSFQSLNSQKFAAANSRTQLRDVHVHGTAHGRGEAVQVIDSAKVTEIAARMLQCVSVLAGLQGPGGRVSPMAGEKAAEVGDGEMVARKKMETLAKELKLNWLGRGRTGRNRKGFVGSRVRGVGIGVGA